MKGDDSKSSRQVSQSTLTQFLASQCPYSHSVVREQCQAPPHTHSHTCTATKKRRLLRFSLPIFPSTHTIVCSFTNSLEHRLPAHSLECPGVFLSKEIPAHVWHNLSSIFSCLHSKVMTCLLGMDVIAIYSQATQS